VNLVGAIRYLWGEFQYHVHFTCCITSIFHASLI
jgi:hypothetical protein